MGETRVAVRCLVAARSALDTYIEEIDEEIWRRETLSGIEANQGKLLRTKHSTIFPSQYIRNIHRKFVKSWGSKWNGKLNVPNI